MRDRFVEDLLSDLQGLCVDDLLLDLQFRIEAPWQKITGD